VALYSLINPRLMLVKCIIVLFGDIVRMFFPYLIEEIVILPGYVWVEGDEPFYLEDSNWFGPVS